MKEYILEELCDIYQPKNITSLEMIYDGEYPVFGANGIIGKYNKYNHEESEVAVTCRGATCGTVNYTLPKSWITGNAMVITPKNNNNVLKKYLYYFFKYTDLSKVITGTAQPQITRTNLKSIKVPLYDRAKQEKIISELDNIEKLIQNRKDSISKLNNLIESKIDDVIRCVKDVKTVKLGEITTKITKGMTPTTLGFKYTETGINFIKVESITLDGNFIPEKFAYINEECNSALKRSQLNENDVLFSIAGAIGRTAVVTKDILPANTNQALAIISINDNYNPKFIKSLLASSYCKKQYTSKMRGVAQTNLSLKDVSEIEIIDLNILEQNKIQDEIEEIERIKKVAENQEKVLENLLYSIMNKYFKSKVLIYGEDSKGQ